MQQRINGFLSRRAVLAVLVALSLTISACGSGSSSSDSGGGTTTVKVGVIPILDVAPLYLGIEKGFFADEGLDLITENAQGGAAIVPAVVSGQCQFGFSNTVSLLLADVRGLELKVVTAGISTTGVAGKDFGAVMVRPESPITSAADLAGKKVAVNTLNNINTVTINEVVRKAGANPSTITFVELPFPEIAPAITRGDVDAGQVVEPFLTIAEQQGGRQVAANFAEAVPNLPVAMYFASAAYAQENPEVVASFTAAMKKSLAYAQSHPDEVLAILSTYTLIDARVQKDITLPRWPTDIDSKAVRRLGALLVKDGLVSGPPDTSALLP